MRVIDACKFLSDAVLPATSDDSMVAGSLKFGVVVGVSAVDQIRVLGRWLCRWENEQCCAGGYREKYWHTKLPGEIIDSHKQILARLIDRLTFQEGGSLFGIEMNQLTRIRFVIALSFVLEMFLDGLSRSYQAFEAVLQCLTRWLVTSRGVNSCRLMRFSKSSISDRFILKRSARCVTFHNQVW